MSATALVAAQLLSTILGKKGGKKKAKAVIKPNKPRKSRTIAKGEFRSLVKVMNTKPAARNRKVSAPVSMGTVTSRASTANHIVAVPFSSISNAIVAVASGGSTLFLTTSATGSSHYDLGPFNNVEGGFQNQPFGIGVSNVAKAYARYRLRSLRVTYVPIVSTGVSGSIIIGATTENYISGVPSPQQAADSQASITTPVWQEASMDLSGLLMTNQNPEWYYTYTAGTDASAQRQNYACSLLTAGIGTGATVFQALGYLRFDGVIEFTSLSDIVGGVTAAAPTGPYSPPSLHREAPSSIEEEKGTYERVSSRPASQQAVRPERGWLG